MQLGFGLGLTNVLPFGTVALDPDAAIAALFESGEEGAWYDPSDLTTVFQDYFGTTAAGVGDPVGLILDKSQGLTANSPELFDGVFETVEDWTNNGDGSWSVSSAGTNLDLRTLPGFTLGKNYVLTFDITITSGTVIAYNAHTAPNIYVTTSGSKKVIQISATQTWIIFRATAGTTATISNISSKELPGNHATQTTSAARPVLQQSGDLYYLDFDGVDDSLETATITIPTSTDFSFGMGFTYSSVPTTHHTALSWGGFVSNGFVFQTSRVSATTYKMRLARNGTTFADGTLNNIGDPHVWTVENSSTGAEVRKDAVADISSTTVTSVGSHVLSLGYRKDANAQWADINLYGTVAINRTLDPDELVSVERYLGTKSGFTAPVITGVPTIA